MQQKGKGLYKVFKSFSNGISQALSILDQSGSEVSYIIPEPRNFSYVIRLSEDINKPCIKKTLKEIRDLINNHTVLAQEPENDESVTPCMDVYKAEIQSDGSLEK